MLSKKKQEKFIRKNYKKTFSHLSTFCENKNAESLHQVRVGIKRLKAFIYFFKKKSQTNHLSNVLGPVKDIFKHAGRIRDAQVNLNLTEHLLLRNKNVREEQEKIIDTESERFCLRQDTAIRDIKRAGQHILPYFTNIKNKSILKFFRREIKKSGRKLQKDLSTDEWHSCRKKIKTILYVYKLSGSSVAKSIPLNLSYLEDLQESIGKWHDTIIASGFITAKTGSAKSLAKKFVHESEVQKEELIDKVQDFIEKSTQQ